MTRQRSNRLQTGVLKVVLIAGGFLSTLLGGELLARLDSPAVEPTPNQILVIPERREPLSLNVSNAPIPQVQIPRPITRSRSSR